MFISRKPKKLPIPFRPRLEILEDRTLLSVCTVDRLTDLGQGTGLTGDLRYCITQAQNGDSITFGVTGTINLTRALPDLTQSISIEGPGADLLTVRRNTGGDYSVFSVAGSPTVSIFNMTINNGSNTGGIYNGGSLMVNHSTISGNSAGSGRSGGGIHNDGSLMVNNSTISGNTGGAGPGSGGGGIYNGGGTLTVNNSTISGNTAGGGSANGGGIYNNGGTLTVNNSTISGNTIGRLSDGGGIYTIGSLTVNNSTISGNTAIGDGGGIHNGGGTLAVSNSTIAGNVSGRYGGGIFVSGAMTTKNTIIAGNTGFLPDVYGNIGSQGHNLIGNSQGTSGFDDTDLLDVDPLLGPLQDNGGPTETMALLPGSPAVDAGDNANPPDFDQRGEGFDPIVGGTIDIGAFEAQIGSATSFRIDAPNSVPSGMPFDVTVTALDAYNHVAAGYTGTVTFTTTDTAKGVVLPADYTFTPDDNGSHTFTDTGETTLITPGDQAITATDTQNDSITGNATVTVTGGDFPHRSSGWVFTFLVGAKKTKDFQD
jgi:hypothetical protein